MPELGKKFCRSNDKIAIQEGMEKKFQRNSSLSLRGEWHWSIPLDNLNLQPEFPAWGTENLDTSRI
jgi:hypothetical protein